MVKGKVVRFRDGGQVQLFFGLVHDDVAGGLGVNDVLVVAGALGVGEGTLAHHHTDGHVVCGAVGDEVDQVLGRVSSAAAAASTATAALAAAATTQGTVVLVLGRGRGMLHCRRG